MGGKKKTDKKQPLQQRGNREVNFSTGILRFFFIPPLLSLLLSIFYYKQEGNIRETCIFEIVIPYFFYAFLFSIRAIFAFSFGISRVLPKKFVSIRDTMQRNSEISRVPRILRNSWNFATCTVIVALTICRSSKNV